MIFLSEHISPIWTVLSSLLGGFGAWLIGRPNGAKPGGDAIGMDEPGPAAELSQRTAFCTMLMQEIAEMRRLIRQHEADKETLRVGLNAAMTQSLVLRATIEIMEKRVAFSRADRTPGEPACPENTDRNVTPD